MDSGIFGVTNADLKTGSEKNRIVYTRRPRKKSSTASGTHNNSKIAQDALAPEISRPLVDQSPSKEQSCYDSVTLTTLDRDHACENLDQINEVENLKTPSPLDNAKKTPRASFGGREHNNLGDGPTTSASESEFVHVEPQVINNVKLLVETRIGDDKIVFKLFKETPKNEIESLRSRLESEVHEVRMLAEKLEAMKLQIALYNTSITNGESDMVYVSTNGRNVGGYSNNNVQPTPVTNGNNNMLYVSGYSDVRSQCGGDNFIDNQVLMRVNSVVRHQESRPMVLLRVNSDMGAVRNLEPRPYHRQLSVAVNHMVNEFVEKEKRIPKANQYYPNSEFLLGKDRLPPENNKRFKLNNGRKHSHAFGFGFSKIRDRAFKSCSALLQKLMNHNFGWVFNVPVDAKALGLVDYHIIIKYPMDLGTVKSRLSENRYTSTMDFAEDVRLVFRNAMTYNPKGQDVHVMAEELSQIFEERWAVIETEYNQYLNGQMYHDLPTSTSGRVPEQSHFPRTMVLPVNVLARTESMTPNMVVDPKIQRPHIVRTPVPKKPKARDLNKRDMTYDEKQKLSSNLQGLPSEKLDAIVQIIKRRNTALSQHDDEIEVDIDNVDAETLWELDRFVTNYKKGLSKNKRKAELARQAGTLANGTVGPTNLGPTVTAMQHEKSGGEYPSVDGQKQRNKDSRSSSSSSSSSDSGSSSDSDSNSSSADGSSHSHKA